MKIVLKTNPTKPPALTLPVRGGVVVVAANEPISNFLTYIEVVVIFLVLSHENPRQVIQNYQRTFNKAATGKRKTCLIPLSPALQDQSTSSMA